MTFGRGERGEGEGAEEGAREREVEGKGRRKEMRREKVREKYMGQAGHSQELSLLFKCVVDLFPYTNDKS